MIMSAGVAGPAAFEAAVSKFGAVDICVNNAGIMDERVWEKMIAINLKNPKMPEMGVRWRCLCPDGINTDLLVLQENQVHDVEDFMKEVRAAGILEPEEVVEAFMKIVQDQDSDDVIFELWKGTKGQYRRRQLVDSDGVSNLVTGE
nr:hypothetical protein BaRGS_023338 [Batillaria attramentaria]